jgi:hypothetical protein
MQKDPFALNTARNSSAANVVLGIWLAVSPFALAFTGTGAALWNDIIVGAAVIILGLVRQSRTEQSTWASWLNVVLGAWLVVAPYALGYSGVMYALWNDIVVGLGIIVLAAWSLFETHESHPFAH